MLDRNTFGKTPACIYLAEHLNSVQNKKLTRKVGCVLQDGRESLNQLYASHEMHNLDVKNYKKFLNFLHADVLIKVEVLNDELVKNLVSNILVGEIRFYNRYLHQAGLFESELQRATPEGVAVPKVQICVDNYLSIEAEELIKLSKERLAQQNKVCTFY